MELFVTRHGQTYGNVQRILQGQQPGQLTELGVQQAKLLGARLQREQFHAVYCSDLARCVQTLDELLPYHTDAQPQLDPRLREKSAGELEGQPLGTTDRLAKEAGVELRAFRAPGGESWQDVQARARDFLMEISQEHLQGPPRKVLVVSHGGWIMELLNVIRELKGQKPVYANRSQNTAVYVIRLRRNGPKLVPTVLVDNDASHLKSLRHK